MRRFILALVASTLWATAADAQQTAGNITGRITDAQNAAIPGATVVALNTQTGFTRTDVSDEAGIYRLNSLPVGRYDVSAELSGFAGIQAQGIVVNVGQTVDVPFSLKVATLQETVTVTGETPLIQTSSSSVGGVVDVGRIESLPLNGRQFANLAATVPGVGLGFHCDPTKSTQYAPQIGGGNGRNLNYQIDGGDNNDDTVGGLLQLFPLEAIQEFNILTSRYKAEYGRSNGGVMNIVTKSGTNSLRGSWFTLVPRQGPERHHDQRGEQRRRQAGLPPLPVRRLVRRSDREGQDPLLRGGRAHPAGHQADRRHAGSLPVRQRHLRHALPRDARHRRRSPPTSTPRTTWPCATAATRTRSPTVPTRGRPSNGWGDQRERVQLGRT